MAAWEACIEIIGSVWPHCVRIIKTRIEETQAEIGRERAGSVRRPRHGKRTERKWAGVPGARRAGKREGAVEGKAAQRARAEIGPGALDANDDPGKGTLCGVD